MKARSAILTVLLFALLTVLFGACSKGDYADAYFNFTADGGPKLYDLEIDGETLLIQSDGESSEPAYFLEDNANPEYGQWFTELEWIRVFYTPATQVLFINVDYNESGKSRSASVTASHDGKRTVIKIAQDK